MSEKYNPSIQRSFHMTVSLEKPIEELGNKILQRAYEMEGMDQKGHFAVSESFGGTVGAKEEIGRVQIQAENLPVVTSKDVARKVLLEDIVRIRSYGQSWPLLPTDQEVKLRLPKEHAEKLKGYDVVGILQDFVNGRLEPIHQKLFDGPANGGMNEWLNNHPINTEVRGEHVDTNAFWPSLSEESRKIKENYPHYHKKVAGLEYIDVYRVLTLFNVTDPCIAHALKKLLVAGGRGAKDQTKDVHEAIVSLQRWEEMRDEENPF